ncbi:unnamed protein product [Phytophthora fragariaefolia]|uniref:Unnamed protein product n=1 Tax=Phytophthora fragariaefolia TaxID=1490495 RepID=A0A9W7CNR3_9STRA|nr:unnamed protein product [Phytophthora fragariaefolia]
MYDLVYVNVFPRFFGLKDPMTTPRATELAKLGTRGGELVACDFATGTHHIDRINTALEVAVTQPPPVTCMLRVCQATEDEWNTFADSDDHIVPPNFLEWFADPGEIHIIEFPYTPHERYRVEINDQFRVPSIKSWLIAYADATNSQGRRWCADLSSGSRRTTPGSVLPPGVPTFDGFRTLNIEIGVSQLWGMARGQLDHKAISIWAVMPGVEYVLCVKFDPDFAKCRIQLYDARVKPLKQLALIPIVAPRTVIQLDGRRILGIPSGMALPVVFPVTLSIDLYPLHWSRQCSNLPVTTPIFQMTTMVKLSYMYFWNS